MGKNEIVLFESRDGAVTLPELADAFDACVGESYEVMRSDYDLICHEEEMLGFCWYNDCLRGMRLFEGRSP